MFSLQNLNKNITSIATYAVMYISLILRYIQVMLILNYLYPTNATHQIQSNKISVTCFCEVINLFKMFTDDVKQTTDDDGQKRIAKGYLEDQNDPKPRVQSKIKTRNQTWLKFQALEVRVGERGFNLEVRMPPLITKVHYILMLTLDLR